MRNLNPERMIAWAKLGAIVGVVGGIAYLYIKRKEITEAAVSAVNPTDPNNLAYRGVNAVGSSITGDEDFSLGVWIYENAWWTKDEREALGPVNPNHVPD